MRLAVFDTHRFDREALERANARFGHTLVFFEPRLTAQTAQLAQGFLGVCSFVNDKVDAAALETLYAGGTRVVALRSAPAAVLRRGARCVAGA
jgi:D-lactate dehydrogenase